MLVLLLAYSYMNACMGPPCVGTGTEVGWGGICVGSSTTGINEG
jgi:hypothetical protein